MYEGEYSAMVEAKVAEKAMQQIMYDVSGNETKNEKGMVGQHSTLHPENYICRCHWVQHKYEG
jgi:hypothetical protein